MTRDRRLLLLLGLLMGLFVAECKYHQREDAADSTETRHHRHRHHRHEPSNRRSHHDLDRRSWQEVDYDEDAEEDSADDYEMQSYYLRSHQQYAQRSYHGRMFEPRYPARYHGGGYHGSGWHDRRKISPRYSAKNRRHGRSHHAYSRDRDASDDDDDTREDLDYERLHVEDAGRRHESWSNYRRHATSPRRTHGHLDAWRHRLKDRDAVGRDRESGRTEYWRKRSNSSDYNALKKENKSEEDEDYKDHGGLEESDKDDEEEEDEEADDIWKIFDDKDEEGEEGEEFDNDFYKSKPAITYDDIIKKLTFDEPTTAKTTVKRDYRNIEDKHTKRESNRSLKYQPKNVSRLLGPFTLASKPFANRLHASTAVSSTVKSAVLDKRKTPTNASTRSRNDWQQERRTVVKIDGAHTKNKRGDLDFDGYTYPQDNEKEDDLDTAEASEEDMQADVTNTGYADDDNGNEEEASADTVSTITTNATRTTSTTMKRLLNQHGKNTRPHERSTAAQYNGYQPKNDYPPMSAHSVYKWRTLGTRESVQQTRNSMQQNNKDGEHAAFQEAIRYWKKVHTEGTCKWPRAKIIRVSDSYPDSSITYHPHCAILHECSDNTGCCKSEALTCAPKRYDPVTLTFYTTSVNHSINVVKLTFYNHTECECQDRDEHNQILGRQPILNQHEQPQNFLSPQNFMKTTSSQGKQCKCTKHFTARKRDDNCQCICQENNIYCTPINKGKRFLDFEDRMCIQNNECTIPNCEFGAYLSWEGKCPGRKDTINAAANHGMNSQHHFRSQRRNARRNREG